MGPLSALSLAGLLKLLYVSTWAGNTCFAAVDLMTFESGDRDRLHLATRMCDLLGKGPSRSSDTSCYGRDGIGEGVSGALVAD